MQRIHSTYVFIIRILSLWRCVICDEVWSKRYSHLAKNSIILIYCTAKDCAENSLTLFTSCDCWHKKNLLLIAILKSVEYFQLEFYLMCIRRREIHSSWMNMELMCQHHDLPINNKSPNSFRHISSMPGEIWMICQSLPGEGTMCIA